MTTLRQLTGLTTDQIESKRAAMREDPRVYYNSAGDYNEDVAFWCVRLQQDDTAISYRSEDTKNSLARMVRAAPDLFETWQQTYEFEGQTHKKTCIRTSAAGKAYAEVFRHYWQNGLFHLSMGVGPGSKPGLYLMPWPGNPDPPAG